MLNELAFPSPSEKNRGITEPRKLRKFTVLEGKKNLIAVDRCMCLCIFNKSIKTIFSL